MAIYGVAAALLLAFVGVRGDTVGVLLWPAVAAHLILVVLLLAGRREDADTLFFQRRLVLTGDTELGLTARNVLDRLPWEQVPLALRIAINRGARFADAARAAYHAPA